MRQILLRVSLLVEVVVMSLGGILYVSLPVRAAQMTSRSLTLSTATPSATSVTHTLNFNFATTNNVGSMEFLYCTTALSTCTAPTGLSVSSATISTQTINGSAGGFTIGTNTANKIQITRTAASVTAGNAGVFAFAGITNPSTSGYSPAGNNTFFVRITSYATSSYTTAVDSGTVAAGIVPQLQVSVTIQEILHFCVGTTTVDDATTSVASDCSGVSGTSMNIGTLDPTLICKSGPLGVGATQNPCQNGDGNDAVALVRTNASNGVNIGYKAVLAATGSNHLGTMRVSGATCNAGTVQTDQCIDAQGTTQAAFSAGTEKFGMTIAGVNCGSTTAYSCVFSTGTYNLARDGQYDGTGANTYGVTGGYAWDESAAYDQIASSASSSSKVVDDEALMIKYAATPSTTTPTGLYSVNADYLAIPTY